MTTSGTEPEWLEAADGYTVALIDGRVRCRNAKGTILKAVPKAVKDTDAVVRLRAVGDYLVQHGAKCRSTVEQWMLGSFPVPTALLAQVWPDDAWRSALANMVVSCDQASGLLLGAQDGKLGLVDLDGETVWCEASTSVLLHPIDIADINDYRELLAELGSVQAVPQLSRPIHSKPSDLDLGARNYSAYEDGYFPELRFALSRAQSAGYVIRGGYCGQPVFDGGRRLQARYWIGSDAPDSPTWTGDLSWVDEDEKTVPLGEVGPIAFSEGVAMAEAVFAGRTEKDEEDS